MVNSWMNKDGLYLKYGTSKAIPETAGDYQMPGANRVMEAIIDLTTLTSSAAVVSDTMFFPTGMQIESVEIFVETAATSGGSATLDIGFQKTDRSTELDYNGLIAAAPLANINTLGDKITYDVGSTDAGALIGTKLTDVGMLTANYTTAAFTAGKIRVRVYYHGEGTITQ